ncbi:hypothetical protein DNTS_000445 [Danionella cerebrum]|uniref:Reelin n=1 Tax=Danionella cerebrum TaxID=2873325 RepID=A0A553QZT3_9TELE|nr:hypothetical protein DNTS_000445 [Danionella translucida]
MVHFSCKCVMSVRASDDVKGRLFPGVMSERPFGTQFVCSVVASHVSHLSSTSLSFVWIAPPPGTGCVNFLATATHRGQIIFKDTLALQLCERGAPTESPLRPSLEAVLHGDHAVLRDDFELITDEELNLKLWSGCSNCEVGEQCGVLMHGRALSFCEPFGLRELTSVSLNTSTASVLQFALDPTIVVSCALNSSDDWITLEKISAPANSSTVLHLIPLISSCRGDTVQLRWSQEPPEGLQGFESCWGLDNVLLLNDAPRPPLLEDTLDPMDTQNWLFFPGATVKHACQSEGNALYFHGGEGSEYSFASTRDVDLHREEGISYWEEDFEMLPSGVDQWNLDQHWSLTKRVSGRSAHPSSIPAPLETYAFTSPWTPSLISVSIPPELQTLSVQFCLEQKSHGGENRHVWALDFLQLLPVLPAANTHLAQFSINLGCGAHTPDSSVRLEFSSNQGRSWSLLHTECLPDVCAGAHLPHSSIYSSENYSGWTRITIPLPNAALTENTRFRWTQTNTGRGNMWAIDNVYVGPSCLRFCSGRGHCSRTGCRCDAGFSGPACERSSPSLPSFLSESFSNPRLSSYSSFSSIRGAEISFNCGVLSSGKALVFNRDSRRHTVTAALDSSQARYLQFTLRLGSRGASGSCPAPDQPGEGVLLHYTCDNGITWTLLQHYSYQSFHEPRYTLKTEWFSMEEVPCLGSSSACMLRIVSVELPPGARRPGVQFRWWQPHHSGRNSDVWALDEISLTSELFNTLILDFSDLLDVSQSLGFYLGSVRPYCRHHSTLSFTGPVGSSSSIRYVETQSMQVGASSMMQFSLVMGCGREPSPNMDTQVRLEFSANHGLTWHFLKEGCYPGMPSCSEFTAPSVYHPSEFTDWRRITLPLPQKTWSSATRFRWIQSYYQEQDEWALDDIYIGQQCLHMCHGHGWCDHGHCRCDEGFSGPDCQPFVSLATSLLSDFETPESLSSSWQEVTGGEIVGPDQGCGVVSSGSSLYFSKAGLRQLVTWDLDTEWAEFVQFYLRMGGAGLECNQGDSREEGLLLQYSIDGGISWNLIAEMYFSDFTKPRFVHFELPAGSKTVSTRFRWWQPVHSGEGYDQWAIDDVIILSEREKLLEPMANPTMPQNFYEKPAFDHPMSQSSVWLLLGNEGLEKEPNASFCSPASNALVFGRSDGDRAALTRDLSLRPGYTLQFKLNIGCESSFSASAPVLLQFSHDAGRSWALVREGCFPSSPGTVSCENSGTELREPTVYYTGDYEQWTRITVVLPRSVAASKTRFRWFQESSVYRDAPAFALDGMYISEPCPNHCGGHGDCISGVCFCDMGYTVEVDGSSCVPSSPSPSELLEDFEGKLSPLWQNINGGQVGEGCGSIHRGKALYFSSLGRREARTTTLDTTHTRLVQFYIRIGSKTLGSSCMRPRNRNEGVIVQFSINNGVQWQLLRELDFGSFMEPQVVTIELPVGAKTPHTVFRWWQPQQGKHSAQWALDSILIGMNDSSRSGFLDSFDGSTPLRVNWYRVEGGEVAEDCVTGDRVLSFSSDNTETERGRMAETWDFEVAGSTFLQFDVSFGCGRAVSTAHGVHLEFSTDLGRRWTLVTPECVPPALGCHTHTQRSVYSAPQFLHWKRVTINLPSSAISPRTRFRWIQPRFSPGADGWALDNVRLMPGCPWLCSGHGLCDSGHCNCDEGFGGPHCVPVLPLPSFLKEDFNDNLRADVWPEVYGAERGTLSGEPLKSGTALIFKGEGLRMLVSTDLDCSHTTYLQFSFKFITKGVPERSHSVLLQFSINGGITWQQMEELFFPSSTETLLVHSALPSNAQTNATRFRLWQPYNSGKKEEVWVIDNLMTNGNSLHSLPLISDSFDSGPQDHNWLFYPGGNTGSFCPYQRDGLEENTAMVFLSNELGEHSITTRDIEVNENTIIQFQIAVGCSSESSAQDPIRLEFSRDLGSSWQLLVPLCSGGPLLHSLCSTELHPSSVYYPGTTRGWRRETISLAKLRICGSVRFRWYQGFYPSGSAPVTWALDSVYIGPQCLNMCSGHGACVMGTHCHCDPGHSGPDCSRTERTNPDFLKEDFEGGVLESELFTLMSGGKPSRKCGITTSGNHLFFSEDGLRTLETTDLNLTDARFVQFFLRLGCGKAAPDPRSQPVLLQFSVDAGLSWSLLKQLLYSNSSNQALLLALELPSPARTSATRLRWWQPSQNGLYYSPWVIDKLVIGGSASGWGPLEDDFSFTDGRSWLLHPGGTRMPVCGSDGGAFAFIEKSHTRYSVTTDISLGPDAFIQFDFCASCSVTTTCYTVELEFSLDLGLSWEPLLRDCLPGTADCSTHTLQKLLVSDTYNKWGRVTLPIPHYARSSATRFRWIQPAPFDKQQTWAIDNLYIGDECVEFCSGHGRCRRGTCVCDPEWTGPICQEPLVALPVQLKDSFSRAPALGHWLLLTGAKISTICGAVASGAALHFSGGCSRQLVTVDLNLTNAEFLQFFFMFGCVEAPSERNQSVLVQFSVDAGVSWTILTEILTDRFRKPEFVNVLLPLAARAVGVRIRWWQPHHDGAEHSDWAIDNVLISGAETHTHTHTHISDAFGGGSVPNHERTPADATHTPHSSSMMDSEEPIVSDHWLFSEDCSMRRFCGSPDPVMMCGNTDGQEVYAITHDIMPGKDWVMQFKISVGCSVLEKAAERQVHVQYSVDFGVSWKYLVPQCLPADSGCAGHVSQPSAFFPAQGWRRAVYPLPETLAQTENCSTESISTSTESFPFKRTIWVLLVQNFFCSLHRTVRFRFYQRHSDTPWALQSLYIGPSCEEHCSGHGDCVEQQCVCEPGFSGNTCRTSTHLETKVLVKERFDWSGSPGPLWLLLEGGRPCAHCKVLVEGPSLYFSGPGARQALTTDLDLRGAKFVEYWAKIGSDDNSTQCHRSTCRRESVLLDYSTDGGVSWRLLHELDFLKYSSVRRDYIELPEQALTNSTRLRWWQPFTLNAGLVRPSSERAAWALDNIMVGGSDINPSSLIDTFDDEGVSHEESWSFYPNAVRTAGFCGNPSFHMYWPNKNQDGSHNVLATRELIVQPGYVLQFKIVVGCDADICDDHHSVHLQYKTDARSEDWQLVQSACLPSSVNDMGCSPFQFHQASIYSSVNSSHWTRVTIPLPDYTCSGATQFRWIQFAALGERHSWAVDQVYIGEACANLCSGHGYCANGPVCICDQGYHGEDCSTSAVDLAISLKDNFESGQVSEQSWSQVDGGVVGSGCGQLSPHAHGDSLYFSGCTTRQAVTREMDLTRASKIMFVLQIGSVSQSESCRTHLDAPDSADRAVLLQFSLNQGINWHIIAHHQPRDFTRAQRVSYNLPL